MGGLEPQWILLGEDLCLGLMSVPGSGPARGQPSAKDTGHRLMMIHSKYFMSFHFLYENKVRQNCFGVGFTGLASKKEK